MDTNMGDDITLNDILQRNFKRQSWDPWLPNSYLCADEQPVQPLAHDPNAQESMTQIMQMQNYLRNNQNPEDLYVSTMNNVLANGDTTRYQSMLKKWQENYSIPSTSRVWFDNTAPQKDNFMQYLFNQSVMGNMPKEYKKYYKDGQMDWASFQKDYPTQQETEETQKPFGPELPTEQPKPDNGTTKWK